MDSSLFTLYSSLFTLQFFRSLLSQGIEIIALFLEQPFTNQSFDGVEDCSARVGIVFTSLKESMQIKFLLLPMCKACEHAFFDFSHGRINQEIRARVAFASY